MTSPWRTVSDKPKPHCWRLVAMQTRGCLQRAGDDDSLTELQASLVGYMAQRGSSIMGAADTRTGHDPTHLQAATRGALMAEAQLQQTTTTRKVVRRSRRRGHTTGTQRERPRRKEKAGVAERRSCL